MPLLTILVTPVEYLISVVAGTSLLFLAILGALAAFAGGAKAPRSVLRVTFWGAMAMALTAAVGAMFGIVV